MKKTQANNMKKVLKLSQWIWKNQTVLNCSKMSVCQEESFPLIWHQISDWTLKDTGEKFSSLSAEKTNSSDLVVFLFWWGMRPDLTDKRELFLWQAVCGKNISWVYNCFLPKKNKALINLPAGQRLSTRHERVCFNQQSICQIFIIFVK